MSDVISRALLCGLGLASLTKEAIEKTAKDFVDHSKISEEEGRRLVKELQRRSTQAQKALEKTVETAVHKVLKNFNLEIIKDKPKEAKASAKKAAGKSGRSGRAPKAGGQ